MTEENGHPRRDISDEETKSAGNGRPKEVKWRRILYEEQPFTDDYIDKSFLESLVTNENMREYDYFEMVQACSTITQQLSITMIFFAVFMFTRASVLSLNMLATIDALVLLVGYGIFYQCHEGPVDTYHIAKDGMSFISILALVSPVLKTLTESYAEDTIWALAILLTFVHLLTFDYWYTNGTTKKFHGTISLNAAVFTSVLLGSRLESNMHVFAFMMFAVELFALFPIARHHIRKYSMSLHTVLTLALVLTAVLLFNHIAVTLSVVLVLSSVVINLLCPLWFIHCQQYKREIKGPWDVAKVQQLN